MEPEEPRPPAASDEPTRTEWKALVRLRERVETAAREIERLRAENAALAAQVAEAEGLALPLEGDSDDVRAQIQGFIDAIDRVLETPETTGEDAAA